VRGIQRAGAAFAAINALTDDAETPIGTRLRTLRHLAHAIEQAQFRLAAQLGADMAKHTAALGIQPSGRPVGEVLAEHEAARDGTG
jgi:hypothetical protein